MSTKSMSAQQGPRPTLSRGTMIGERYALERVLGEGGMGTVYEAVHHWSERRVAIKIMHSEYALDEVMAARFLREGRTAARVDHPNVVQLLDMGRDDATGVMFLVHERLHGEDLRTILDQHGPLSLRDALQIVVPILSALESAHGAGIVHRDIKPENIVLTRTSTGDRVPKLIDFGLARELHRTSEDFTLTHHGALLGTPLYMSPEQARGDAGIDALTDIWSMGIVLFELLTGQPPFEGETFHQLLARVLTAPVPRVQTLAPDIPPSVGTAISHALERDRNKRTVSAQSMLDELVALPELQSEPWIVALEQRYSPSPILQAMLARPNVHRHRPHVPSPTRQIRLGYVPTTRLLLDQKLLKQFVAALHDTVELIACDDYASLIARAQSGVFAIGWFPPVAFVRARREAPVVALRSLARAGRADYVSAVIARADGRIDTLHALRGMRAAWVDPWSAAGFLMPRRMLRRKGLDPNKLFAEQRFVGSYSNVIEALHLGETDVGAAYCSVDATGAIVRAGWSGADGLRVLGLSEPIPGDVLCATAPDHVPQLEVWLQRLETLLATREGQGLFRAMFNADDIVRPDSDAYRSLAIAVEEELRTSTFASQ